MITTCTKENLVRGLAIVERAGGRNPTLPVLAHVAVQTRTGNIILATTDLEIAIATSVPAKSDGEDEWTVPLRVFSGFVNSLPEGNVQMKKSGKQVVIKSGTFQGKIQCGAFEDFPIIPRLDEAEAVQIEAPPFLRALEDVLVATAVTETRPELTGVAVSIEGNHMQLVATDTFRLALRVLSYEASEVFSIIFPQRSAQEILRLFKNTEKVRLRIAENQCIVETDEVTFVSRLLEGTFPDFRAILPREAKTTLRLPREELLVRLEAAVVFTSRLNDVRLSTGKKGDELTVRAANPDVGAYETTLKSEEGKGEEQDVAFNIRYLLDGIRGFRSDDVILELSGEEKPALFRPGEGGENDLYLAMPIRTT